MRLRAILGGILMVGYRGTSMGEEEPGWYLFELEAGHSFVARLVGQEKDSYTILYQGSILELAKQDLKGLRRAATLKGPSEDLDRRSAGPSAGKDPAPSGMEAAGPDQELFRDAIEDLALLDDPRTAKACLLLAANLPKVRPLLHDAFRHASPFVRGRVVKLLGEKGSARENLKAVSGRLSDSQPMVRLAAVMAVRALGPEGFSVLMDYLGTETIANHRKMAVKTLHLWKDPRAVKPLVARMERERDRGVLEFMERALEDLTGRKLGQDPAAWRAWLEEEERRKEEEKIIRSGDHDSAK